MAIHHLTFHFSLGAQRRKNRCLSSSPPESRKNCLRFIRINVTLCLQTNRNCLGFSLWLACNAFNLIWLRRNILLSIFGKKANELQFSVLTNRNENLQNEAKTFTQHKCERKQKYFWSNLICEMWTRRACESVKWMFVCGLHKQWIAFNLYADLSHTHYQMPSITLNPNKLYFHKMNIDFLSRIFHVFLMLCCYWWGKADNISLLFFCIFFYFGDETASRDDKINKDLCNSQTTWKKRVRAS